MKFRKFFQNTLSLTALVCGLTGSALAVDGYFTGGDTPLPIMLQHEMDKRADQIRLGFNTSFISGSGYDPVQSAQIVIDAVDSLEEEDIPGMVIFFDSFGGDNMPIAIGNRMNDPGPRPTQWSTIYNLDELTGPVVTFPFLLQGMENGSVHLSDKVAGVPLSSILMQKLRWKNAESAMAELYEGKFHTIEFSDDRREAANNLDRLLNSQQIFSGEPDADYHSLHFYLLGRELAKQDERPIRKMFMEEVAAPLGMVNSLSGDFIPSWRNDTAPGPFSNVLDRLAWGESAKPSAYTTGEFGAHDGLFSTADDLGIYARFLIQSWHLGAGETFSSQTLQQATRTYRKNMEPGNDNTDHDPWGYGLGVQTGVYGPKSFGWTATSGRALWIDPETNTFCIILSNPEFPDGLKKNYRPVLNAILRKISDSIITNDNAA